MKTKDFWAGFLFLSLGAVILFALIPMGVVEPRKIKYAALSPSYYPRLVGAVIALIGLTIVLRTMLAKHGAAPLGSAEPQAILKVGAVFAILAITGLALPWAGFVLAGSVALVVLMVLAGERNPMIILVIALTLPLLLYLFFGKVASIPIPGGILEPYLRRL